jgi:hypothetical protein
LEFTEWTIHKNKINYSCSLNEKDFCFGATSGNPHGEWGSSCSIKEFLKGKNQDFVKTYFPDKFDEIIKNAKQRL